MTNKDKQTALIGWQVQLSSNFCPFLFLAGPEDFRCSNPLHPAPDGSICSPNLCPITILTEKGNLR